MSELVDKQVGERLRQLRNNAGLSQSSMGEAVGVTFQQIQKYEKGMNRVSPRRLQQFAAMLDVPVGYFFGEPAKVSTERNLESMEAFLESSEGQSLAGAFRRIDSKTKRKAIVTLVEALADSGF